MPPAKIEGLLVKKFITVLVVCCAGPLFAATIRVNSTADNATPGDGLVTLREAILASVNATTTDLGDTGTGIDTIVFTTPPFDVPQTITLASQLPDITSTLTIQGSVAGVTVSGAGTFQVFRVMPPKRQILAARGGVVTTTTISNMTIANGLAKGSDGGGGAGFAGGGGGGAGMGGGLAVFGQNVTLTNVNFTNCVAQGGMGGTGGSGTVGQLGGNGTYGGGGTLNVAAAYSGGGAGGDGEAGGNGRPGGFGGGGGGGYAGNVGASGGRFGGLGGQSDTLNSSGGGGGAGLGGALFVRTGFVTATGCTFTSSHAIGGIAGAGNNGLSPASAGDAAGGAIFVDGGGVLSLTNCTIDTADAKGIQNFGGGIAAYGATTVTNSIIKNCSVFDPTNDIQSNGGGIYTEAALTITSCTFDSNQSGSDDGGEFPFGSAIAQADSGSALSISFSTFTNNTGHGPGGGAVYAAGSSNTIDSCYFSNNKALASLIDNGYGGGVVTENDTTLVNCTFFNNSATEGSSMNLDGGSVTAINCTFSESGSSGIAFGTGNLTMVNCIMDAAFKNTNVESPPSVGTVSYSLVRSLSAGDRVLTDGGNNLIATTAQMLLSAPGNYGGKVETIGLLPQSPALDSATSVNAPAVDARGVTRPQGAGFDMGAFESRGFTLAIAGGNNQSTMINTQFPAPLAVTLTSADGVSTGGLQVVFARPDVGASCTFGTNPATFSAGAASTTAKANGTAGSYSVTASVAGVANSVTFNLTNTTILPPVIVSTLSSPDPAHPGDVVTLTVVATDPQGLPLTYTFDYGDGLSGTSNMHQYGAVGSFTATVTVSNGFLSAMAPIPVLVVINPGSNFRWVLHITSHGTDNVTITGFIHIPTAFTLSGKTFTLNIGGNIETFTLDANGKGTNADGKISMRVLKRGGVPDSHDDTFTAVFKSVNFASKLKQPPLDSSGLPLNVMVTVSLDTINLISTGKANFHVQNTGFGGTASFPPRR